jgi:hypothetical protein
MNATLILLSAIMNVVANALSDPKVTANAPAPAWAGYLQIAAQLATLGTTAVTELATLNDQLVAAVAAKRGLTADEITAYKNRDDIATAKLSAYLASTGAAAATAKQAAHPAPAGAVAATSK